jgi:hypothetical protein
MTGNSGLIELGPAIVQSIPHPIKLTTGVWQRIHPICYGPRHIQGIRPDAPNVKAHPIQEPFSNGVVEGGNMWLITGEWKDLSVVDRLRKGIESGLGKLTPL